MWACHINTDRDHPVQWSLSWVASFLLRVLVMVAKKSKINPRSSTLCTRDGRSSDWGGSWDELIQNKRDGLAGQAQREFRKNKD